MLKKAHYNTKGERIASLIVHLISVYEALIFITTLGVFRPTKGKLEFLTSDLCDRLEEQGRG